MRKRAAVLGSPIAHSLSPAIHNAAYLALGIEGKYDAVEVKQGELSGFMQRVKETDANWIGFSLTMPLKEELLAVADVVDPLAQKLNSGNTLIPTDKGWLATSTDVAGFIWSLAFHEIDDLERIQIIGNGATARAAAAALDAPNRKIQIISRSEKNNELLFDVVSHAQLEFQGWSSVNLDGDLVINTTPSGVADNFEAGQGVYFDVIYHPWPTVLAKRWQGRTIDGLELLVHQAVDQIHLMTGYVIDRQAMAPLLRAAALAEIESRK